MKKLLLFLAAVFFLVACSKDIQTTEAVRQGILDYLGARTAEIGIDMNNIEVKVTSVSFETDVARASVSFVPKGVPGGGGMAMNYVLDRKGDKWAVRGRQSDSSNPHGGGPPLPGVDGQSSPEQPSGQLPSGHPSVGTKQ